MFALPRHVLGVVGVGAHIQGWEGGGRVYGIQACFPHTPGGLGGKQEPSTLSCARTLHTRFPTTVSPDSGKQRP